MIGSFRLISNSFGILSEGYVMEKKTILPSLGNYDNSKTFKERSIHVYFSNSCMI